MLRLVIILILLPFVSLAQLKTDAQLTNDLNNLVPNNTSQLIKPVHIRTVIQNGYDSRVSMYGETGILGKLTYASLFTFSDQKDIVNKKYVDDAIAGFSGGVPSFNGRAGAITPLSTDYSAFYYPATGNPSGFLTSISVTAPLTYTSNVLAMPAAGSSQNGYLSSTDWNTFNGKQNAIGYTAANDANVVHKTGDESIDGNKTFTSPILSSGYFIPSSLNLSIGSIGVNGSRTGTNITGTDLLFASGLGSGTGSSSMYFNTSTRVTSGTGGQNANTRAYFNEDLIYLTAKNLQFITDGNTRMSINTTGDLTINNLAGIGTRVLQASNSGGLSATSRLTKVLYTTTTTVTNTSGSTTDYGVYAIPAGTFEKNGDAIVYSFHGQKLTGGTSATIEGYVNSTIITGFIYSDFASRSLEYQFKITRISDTEIVRTTLLADTKGNNAGIVTVPSLAANALTVKCQMSSTGASFAGYYATVEFKPAP